MADCSEFRCGLKAQDGFRYPGEPEPTPARPPLGSTLITCLMILLAATGLGLAFNWLAPQGIGLLPEEVANPRWQTVDLSQAHALHGQGALFIDARDPGDYRAGRVRGAISLPPAEYSRYYPMLKSQIAGAKTLVIYGRSHSRWPAAWVAQELAKDGHGQVKVMQASPEQWQKAGHPYKTPRRRRGS